MSMRHYLFPKEGEPQRRSRRLIEGLVFGRDSIPLYAGTHQKVAAVTLENDGLKPIRILNTAGYIWEVDADGSVSDGFQRTLGEFMKSALDTPTSTEGTVVSLRPKLTKKLLEERHRWIWAKPRSIESLLIFGQSKSRTDCNPQKVCRRKRLLSLMMPGTRATRLRPNSGNWIRFRWTKEPSLKGFIFEARHRSLHDPDHGFLYRAVAEMAEYRLELMRRHLVGKGVWYALVSVIMWNDDGVGTSLSRYHKECAGKQAAVAAARHLLAEHAGEFGENITVEAEVLTDLEWEAQSHYHR